MKEEDKHGLGTHSDRKTTWRNLSANHGFNHLNNCVHERQIKTNLSNLSNSSPR